MTRNLELKWQFNEEDLKRLGTTPGEIWGCMDTSYLETIEFRPKIKYAKRIIHDGYGPHGRGLPEGIEGPDGTVGKQLAIYRAADGVGLRKSSRNS